MDIHGHPLLWYVIHTLKQSSAVQRIVIATTEKPEDDVLVELARKEGVDWFRGSEADVLDRYYRTACRFPDRYYFRATGDNPILDGENPYRTLTRLIRSGSDYACETGMPVGSIVECFTHQALERCHQEAESQAAREHVTLHMRESGLFRTDFMPCPEEYRCSQLRLTVDDPEDFQRARLIIGSLYQKGFPGFGSILHFCRENCLV